MKRTTALFLLACSSQLSAITSNMTPRAMGTSPLLYKMIDYSKLQTSYEVEPIFSAMYDSVQVNQNMILSGKSSLIFDQQGQGDLNPVWLNLMSNNSQANYNSIVTFTPKLTQSGVLFHWYDQFDSVFFDVKTALIQCKSEVLISEVGGGNGLNPGILNAQQAFTQADWNYGKIGESNHVVGLDNIELRIGKISKATSNASTYDLFMSGFGLIEIPTGSGTKAEWLFEPQVGTNHFGVGFGFEALVSNDDDLKFMIAGNYRYLTPAWETRSFDLLGNGQWSRYLSVQDTYGLPTAPTTVGLPGINFFTQQAYIAGRSEINFYTRLAKQLRSSYFELSYNFFCIQQESIGAIKNITPGYGIYALTGSGAGAGGVTTSSTATINQNTTILDPIGSPVAVTTDRFDKLSAAAGAYATNTLAARFEIKNNKVIYGFGAAIQAAQSASALSSWAVWAKFEYLFDNITDSDDTYDFSSELYDFDPVTESFVHHPVNMNDNGLSQDVIVSTENDFMEDLDSFEFQDDDLELDEEKIDILNKNLNLSKSDLKHDQELSVAAQTIAIEPIHVTTDQLESIRFSKGVETLEIAPEHVTTEQCASIQLPIEKVVTLEIAPEHAITHEQNGIEISVETNAPTLPVQETDKPENQPSDSQDVATNTDEDEWQETTENQTVSLENHQIVPQAEDGILLTNDSLQTAPVSASNSFELTQENQPVQTTKHDEVQAMSSDEMATLLHPDTIKAMNKTMTDANIPAPMPINAPALTNTPVPTLEVVNSPESVPLTEEEILNKLDSAK